MKVTFLGTGTSQGVPIIACKCSVCTSKNQKDFRLRSSILIQYNDINIVIDTGPDFRQQMLFSEITTCDAILFTHAHRDHLAGLDDIRAFNYVMKKPIDVYCETQVDKAIRREFYYCFEEIKYPGVPEMDIHIIDETPFVLFDKTITPLRVWHHNMPVLGFRIDDFVYITDANKIDDYVKEKIKGCEVLVLNALRRESHVSHFTLAEAVELCNELKPKKAFFTHISHQLGMHNEVNNELPEHINLAYDGLQLNF
jgi:phosphoribosyl 1,2-cyclic phosphate phosphodiesterase